MLAVLAFLAASCGQRGGRVPELIGEVNNEYLTTDEFMHHLKLRGGMALEGKPRRELKRWLVAELVDRKLLLQEVRRRRIRVSRDEVGEGLRRMGAETRSERRRVWEVEDDLYEEMAIEVLLRNAIPPPEPWSRAKVKAYVREHPEEFTLPPQVRLRQIVVNSGTGMKKVLKEIRAGMSFTDAARRYSVAPEGRTGGGLRWSGEAELPPEVWKAAWAAAEGAVVGPVASRYGVHLVRVEGKRKAGGLSHDETDALARRRMDEERRRAAVNAYIGKLRKGAVVRLDMKAVDAI